MLCGYNQLQVLDGNREAADLLAAVVHTAIIVKPDSTLAAKIPKIPLDNLGIWIDPIGKLMAILLTVMYI